MDIQQFLVSDQPHAWPVTLPDGSEQTLYFLYPTAADIRRWQQAEKSNEVEQRIYGMQNLIAACLYDPELKRRVFEGPDYAKHRQLSYAACDCLLPPILELAGIWQEKKASQ